jgi:hypothetical protein
VTDEFDPDKWWTWPIPDEYVNTRHEDGRPWRLSLEGMGWIDGFEAGRNSMAEEILASPEGQQMTRSIVRDL